MKGCDSHLLNLAVQEMLGPEEKRSRTGAVVQQTSLMKNITTKLDHCMGALKTLKNAYLQRTKTPLKPERRYETRWSSLYNMIKNLSIIKDHVIAVQE